MKTHGTTVFHLAYARCRSWADAEDIFQEVFLKLCAQKMRFQTDEHLKAWLIRTTVNASINLFKSAWRRYVIHGDDTPPTDDEPTLSPRQAALRDALQKLPQRDRVALYLRYYEDMTAEEIARTLNEKPSTVRSRIARGRRKLKDMILEEEAL